MKHLHVRSFVCLNSIKLWHYSVTSRYLSGIGENSNQFKILKFWLYTQLVEIFVLKIFNKYSFWQESTQSSLFHILSSEPMKSYVSWSTARTILILKNINDTCNVECYLYNTDKITAQFRYFSLIFVHTLFFKYDFRYKEKYILDGSLKNKFLS